MAFCRPLSSGTGTGGCKVVGVLKLPVFQMLVPLFLNTSLEIVGGFLQKDLEMVREDLPSFKTCSMYMQS